MKDVYVEAREGCERSVAIGAGVVERRERRRRDNVLSIKERRWDIQVSWVMG